MKTFVRIPSNDENYNVQFPEKCVYCAKPREMIVPLTATRSTGDRYNRVIHRATFQVPYCVEHSNAAKKYRNWLTAIFFTCIVFSFIAQILISFSLNLQDVFQVCVLGPALALIFAFLVGNLTVRKIWGNFNEAIADLPSAGAEGGLGLSMFLGVDGVGLAFTNQQIGTEFAHLNGLTPEFSDD